MDTVIRKIRPADSPTVANIIRTVMPEFGATGQGFAIHDKEVDDIYLAYASPRAAYFVCEVDGHIVGGGGIAPLQGGAETVCELKKMYFLPAGRGKGLGEQLLLRCLDAARDRAFDTCYLETFNTMQAAMKLYEKLGFKKISGAMGNTGHFACDTFYSIDLRSSYI